MKKSLLIAFLILGILPAFAQKAKYHRFTFYYKQLPLVPLEEGIESYSPKVVLAYQSTVEQMQASYNQDVKDAQNLHAQKLKTWEQEYKIAEKKYQKELAEYNKQTTLKKLAGKELLGEEKPMFYPPEKPYYIAPEPPVLPRMHDTKKLEDKYVILEGYKRGISNPVFITFSLGMLETRQPTSVGKTRTVKQGDQSVQQNYTQYTLQYKQPVTLIVESSLSGKVLYNKVVPGTESYRSKSYDDSIPLNFMEPLENSAIHYSMETAQVHLNNQFGIAKRSLSAEIGYGEGKKHNYNDYQTALETALSGYNNLYLDEETARKKLRSAIEIWTKALTEYNPNSKKARVGRKIGVATMMNIGAAALFANEFDKSEMYFTKAETNDPTSAQLRVIQFYKNLSRGLKERYLNNNP